MKTAISEADAVPISTPEYNYGVPGVLKNAIDCASRPAGKSVLNCKPAAIMGCSPGPGNDTAQHALRQTFVFTETYVMLPAGDQDFFSCAAFRSVRAIDRREHAPAPEEVT
jgi:NAD(P)H-dependent FMN reductase